MLRRTFALFFLLAACGTDAEPDDSDDATGPRFYEDVAPILAKSCVSCHQEGGVAPFSLITYEDAIGFAAAMPSAVRTRQMPPWGTDNSGACNTYQDARWLTDDEIATIAAWAEGDRQKGDPAAAPRLPDPLPGLPRVDKTAAMPEPYTADTRLGDDYRCFIVDPAIAQDAFLTGFEVRPGEPSVVHHMLLFQLQTAEAEAAAAQLDAQSPGPGYTCFGGVGSAASSLVGVWAPGVRASRYPEGTGLPVKGGRKMVVQIHYHNHGAPLADKTAIDLMIEPTVAEPSFLYLLAAPNLYLPPGKPEIVTTNQYQLPGFLGQYNVWGVFPHMHTRGRSLRVEVDHAGQNQCITDVPRWDFNWQQGYFYDGAPRIAGGGDTVRITCTHNTTMEDQPITWGEGTDDEMCLAFLYVSPY
ncbi:MAG TPA: hypothetical protein VNO30_17365 [Kofleriaceae bacterium]|nr:hypothetical protein [Kofleriaceae bacterium]